MTTEHHFRVAIEDVVPAYLTLMVYIYQIFIHYASETSFISSTVTPIKSKSYVPDFPIYHRFMIYSRLITVFLLGISRFTLFPHDMSTADVLRSVRSLPSQLNDNRVVTEHELETTHNRLSAELNRVGKSITSPKNTNTAQDSSFSQNRPFTKQAKAEVVNETVFDPSFNEYDDATTFGIALPSASLSGGPASAPSALSPRARSRMPSKQHSRNPSVSAVPPHVPLPEVIPPLAHLQQLPPLLLAHLTRPLTALQGPRAHATATPASSSLSAAAATALPFQASLPPSHLRAMSLLPPTLRAPTPTALWRAALSMYSSQQPRLRAMRHMLLARVAAQLQRDTRTGHYHTHSDNYYGTGVSQGLESARVPLSALYAHALVAPEDPYRDSPTLATVLTHTGAAVGALARAVDAVDVAARVGARRLALLGSDESEAAWAAGAGQLGA